MVLWYQHSEPDKLPHVRADLLVGKDRPVITVTRHSPQDGVVISDAQGAIDIHFDSETYDFLRRGDLTVRVVHRCGGDPAVCDRDCEVRLVDRKRGSLK